MDLSAYLDPATIARLQTGGYIVMLWLMIVEWPIVTFIASFLASLGIFSLPTVLIFGWIGDIIGDLLYFSLGRFSTRAFAKIHKKDTPANSVFLTKLDRLIHTNLFLSIFVVKFTPYIQPIGLTYIGKLDTPVRKYILYSLLLCIPIPFVFGMMGYHLGRMNELFIGQSKENIFLVLAGAVGVIGICVLFWWYLINKSQRTLETTNPHK